MNDEESLVVSLECCICLELQRASVALVPCFHLTCRRCVERLYERSASPTCPQCRAPIERYGDVPALRGAVAARVAAVRACEVCFDATCALPEDVCRARQRAALNPHAASAAAIVGRVREPLVLWPPLYKALLSLDEAATQLASDDASVARGFLALAKVRAAAATLATNPVLEHRVHAVASEAWRRLSAALLGAGNAALAIACARVALDELPSSPSAREHAERLLADNETSYHENAQLRREQLALAFERDETGVRVERAEDERFTLHIGLSLE